MSFVDVRDCAAQHVAAMEMEDKEGRFMSHLVVCSQQESWKFDLAFWVAVMDWEERSTVGEIQLAQMTMPQDDIECLLHGYDSYDQFVDEYVTVCGIGRIID